MNSKQRTDLETGIEPVEGSAELSAKSGQAKRRFYGMLFAGAILLTIGTYHFSAIYNSIAYLVS